MHSNICDAAVDQPYSKKERKHSYYFVNKDGKVLDQRPDRVLMDLETAERSAVKVRVETHLIKKFENEKIDIKD